MNRDLNTGGGSMPSPITGHALPIYEEPHISRVGIAMDAFEKLLIPYAPQTAIKGRMEVLRIRCLGKRGVPLPGLRLSQVSQAGKSKALTSFRDEAMARAEAAGEPFNPYRILYVRLDKKGTLKMLCRRILRMLGDPHDDVGNLDDVRLRLAEFMVLRGVELLIIDEVQHLKGSSNDKEEITDELKGFLDAGIVPVVMAGNEEADEFFNSNIQFAGRLGSPLELSPIDISKRAEAVAFKTFCKDLDTAMKDADIVRRLSGFQDAKILNGLLAASGGHVGRVCRIVEAALEHAIQRDADFIETYDLAYAVETFAIPKGYVIKNPFGQL
ncbi:TniB family NTP-binding protein [Sphingomonas aerophila]|uniref:AAA+ ATPase domain-containing protein n=1 Tax=Sphingomonas aerophila TaxID=1344948 RepID=A0A7W9BG61_9SPHN|nr:TniB family NTP-binding protein [Sphingomonas aerophila]MBB5716246.1 hypothetical protein [Sphingomonas aerophila]